MIVLAARAAGIAAFDGVFNGLDDPDGLAAEAADGRRLGFDGKSLIHPNQIAVCHAAFAPSKEGWFLEPRRPDVGYWETVAAGCNPGDVADVG